jgi:ABC-type lipoprotein release transport system permease subunit
MLRPLLHQLYLVDYALRGLLRSGGRNAAVVAVYALLVLVLASTLLLGDALRGAAGALLAEAPEVVVQRQVAGRTALVPAARLDRVAGIRGVTRAEGRLWGYLYDPAVEANYTVMVPRTGAPAPGMVEVGPALARARGLAAGDVLAFRDAAGEPRAFRVAGLLDPATALAGADLMLMRAADFRSFFAIPEGHYTDLALAVRNPREVDTVAGKVLAALPDSRVVTRAEMLRTYAAVFSWRQGLVWLVTLLLLLAFLVLAWDQAAALGDRERHDIGVLKALGWGTGDVLAMKLWQGLLISATAFGLGYLGAWWHVAVLGAPLLAPVLQGWSVLYPELPLAVRPEPAGVLGLALLTVAPYVAATLVPAWRVAVTDPHQAMR